MFRNKKARREIKVRVPAPGEIVPLTEVPDDVFRQRILGEGFAVIPESGEFCAPIDGRIVTIFPTKHAFGIRANDGTEILVHIGIDTVNLKGEGFEALKQSGDRVRAGDLILRADLERIAAAGFSVVTPVVILAPKGNGRVERESDSPHVVIHWDEEAQ